MVPRFRERVVEPPLGLGTPGVGAGPRLRPVPPPAPLLAGRGGRLARGARRRRAPRDDAVRPAAPAVGGVARRGPARREGRLPAEAAPRHHRRAWAASSCSPGCSTATRETDPDKPQPLPPVRRRTPRPVVGARAPDRATTPRRSPSVPTHIARAAGAALRDPIGQGPRRRGASGSRRSACIGDPGAAASPLLATRGPDWRFVALDLPFAPFAGRREGRGRLASTTPTSPPCSAAFRRYHEARGAPVEEIRMAIPVSRAGRRRTTSGGNKIASLRLAGRIGEKDPAARMAQVAADVARGRGGTGGGRRRARVAAALARLPGPVIAAGGGRRHQGQRPAGVERAGHPRGRLPRRRAGGADVSATRPAPGAPR